MQNKLFRFTVYLPDEIILKLKGRAAQTKVPVSNIARELITSGLPAEIEARRKQYQYYRDKLLTFKKAS